MAIGDQTRTREYTVGRGQVYFKASTSTVYKQLGNTPEMSFTQELEDLKHYSSREGVNVQDAYVVLQQDVMASFVLDEFDPDNLKLFFMSALKTETDQTGAALQTTTIVAAAQGGVYDIGAYDISVVVVSAVGGSPDYVLNTDYEVDLDAGVLFVTDASAIDGDTIEVSFTKGTVTSYTVNAATTTTVKGDFWFVGDPPIGARIEVKGYCSLKPGGDVGFISDEWMSMPFEAEFEENASYVGLIDVTYFGHVT